MVNVVDISRQKKQLFNNRKEGRVGKTIQKRRFTKSSPSIEDAILLAALLHKGQRDKAGAPYILHPLRVMLDSTLTTDTERIVAVLHDVVEDGGINLAKLSELGYASEIVKGVELLTKLPHEENDYDAFIQRICNGPELARKVKLADLRDNADLSRIAHPTERDFKRQEKYLRAINVIEETFTRG